MSNASLVFEKDGTTPVGGPAGKTVNIEENRPVASERQTKFYSETRTMVSESHTTLQQSSNATCIGFEAVNQVLSGYQPQIGDPPHPHNTMQPRNCPYPSLEVQSAAASANGFPAFGVNLIPRHYSPVLNNSPTQFPDHNDSTSMNPYQNQYQGTLRPLGDFDPKEDAARLKKAMKGIGCDKDTVVGILCHRTNAQRQQIKSAYKTMHGKDLVKDLTSELKGHVEDIIVALMHTPADYDASELRKSMKGAGTNEATLIEILSSRSNTEIHAIRNAYKTLFKRDLEKDLISDTSGHFRRLLVSLSTGERDENTCGDQAKARKDAEALYKAGEKKLGTDESMFNVIIASQSVPQLQLVFQEYHKVTSHGIEKAIETEFSGDIKDGLLSVVKCIKNRPAYFAERLHLAMKGLGTKDDQLIRIVITRCEVDMVQIKQEFKVTYGKTLEEAISGDTSGKYKEALLTLVRGN